ncbi:MAG: type II secretion system F family protein [Alcaligenaceae bacterium]
MIVLGFLCAIAAVILGTWIAQRLVYEATQKYRNQFTEQARIKLSDLFVFIDLTHLWPALLGTSAGFALLCWLLMDSIVLSTMLGVFIFVLPRIALNRAKRKRQVRLDQQLPDLLLALSGALRAGASLSVALKSIVQDASAPLSQEFGLVLREQRMGISLSEALANFYQRMPSESVELVTTILTVGTRSGGSLAELLERLCNNLRARQHLEGKIQVMTTQGKMQAWIMGALPLVLLLVLSQVDPISIHLLHSTSVGWGVIATVITLECLGVIFLRRILAIHV